MSLRFTTMAEPPIAIEAGLLSKAEVKTAYLKMQENVRNANAATIGLTIYPVYPAGTFKNKRNGALFLSERRRLDLVRRTNGF